MKQYATRSSDKHAKQDAGRLLDLMHTWVHRLWHLQTWQESLKGCRILPPLLQDLGMVPLLRPLVSDSTSDAKYGKTRRRRFKSRGEVSGKSTSSARPPKKRRSTVQEAATDPSEDEEVASQADMQETFGEESTETSECTEEASFEITFLGVGPLSVSIPQRRHRQC